MSINRVVLVGRLVKDPELRYTPSGVPTARFTVAVNRTFSNQNGEREADFVGCVAWRKQAENLVNFMKKGALVGVEGAIRTSSFEGQDGKRVYVTEVHADSIQFLESRSNGSGSSQGAPNNRGNTNYQSQPNNAPGGNNQPNYTRVDEDPFANRKGPVEVSESDLPF